MNFIESVSVVSRPFTYSYSNFLSCLTGCMTVLKVFSFVFGDGDPNQGIEEERWKLVMFEH